MRVGLIGTGFGTRVHLPAMRASSHIEVVAICSAQRARADAAADQWRIPFATDDYEELLQRDEVELVDICTPPDSHAQITIAALGAGKHVLCEKPLALDLGEAEAMAAAVEKTRVRVPALVDAVHHEMRYFPFRRLLRSLVSEGYLGELRYVVQAVAVDFGVNPMMEPYWYTWVARKEQGGGFLTGMLSHEIDLLRYTFGDLYEVYGNVSIAVTEKPVLGWDYRDGDAIGPDSPRMGTQLATADDTAVVTGRFHNGAPLVLTGTWAAHNGTGNRLEAYGSEGTIVVSDGVIRGARKGETLAAMPIPAEYELDLSTGERMVPASTRLFADLAAVVDGRTPPSEGLFASIADAVKTQQVIESVREQGGERVIGGYARPT